MFQARILCIQRLALAKLSRMSILEDGILSTTRLQALLFLVARPLIQNNITKKVSGLVFAIRYSVCARMYDQFADDFLPLDQGGSSCSSRRGQIDAARLH